MCVCIHMMQQYPDYIASEALWIVKAKEKTYLLGFFWHTQAEEVGGGDYRKEGAQEPQRAD